VGEFYPFLSGVQMTREIAGDDDTARRFEYK